MVARTNAARVDAMPKGKAQAEKVVALDRTIHEPMRLGIISALAVNESLTFNELKSLLGVTDGNLSVHARKLEEAGFVECTKSFAGRVPRTDYKVTAEGRAALEKYVGHMESILRATKGQR
ncbi:MAG: transcriptional regulator [Acidobacteria bacterium]|nr:transcriptional regulator [Acidobacteriota bacterium]